MEKIQIEHISPYHLIAYRVINDNEEDILFGHLKKSQLDLSPLSNITNKRRRIEWMASRYELQNILNKPVDLIYDNHGKPCLVGAEGHLSISHSEEMLAISIHRQKDTGIDIQKISPRIKKLAPKFMIEGEMDKDRDDEIYLTICWAVKEAMFKYHGKQDFFLGQNFRIDNMVESADQLVASGSIIAEGQSKKVAIQVKQIKDYILAYVVNS